MLMFHGSIHEFEAFDVSKVRTGAGMTNFGNGLYFTGEKACAANYAGGVEVLIDGVSVIRSALAGVRHGTVGNAMLDGLLVTFGNDLEGLRRWMADTTREPPYGRDNVSFRSLHDEVSALCGRVEVRPIGYIYEVEFLACKSRLLDLGTPLAEQPQGIRDLLWEFRPSGLCVVEVDGRGLSRLPAEMAGLGHCLRNAKKAGADIEGALQSLGYVGTRYVTNYSRASGAGYSNYAIFDTDVIRIVRRESLTSHGSGRLAA